MAGTDHTPGEPPPVRDEAGPTPMWVPVVGLALLFLTALMAVYQDVSAPEPAADDGTIRLRFEFDSGDTADGDTADGDTADADTADAAE